MVDSTSNNKRRSSANVNIWIHPQDDSSSVSSLSSAFVLGGGSSSFYKHHGNGECTIMEASFDLSLMLEEDSDEDSLVMSVGRPQQRDWRWESDPNLPLQRDLGKNVDTPVIPLRRYSSKESSSRRSLAAAAATTKRALTTTTKRNLWQRPRMPRRQLSSDDCSSSNDDEVLLLPSSTVDTGRNSDSAKKQPQSRGKPPTSRVEIMIGKRTPASNVTAAPSSPFFSERMRRFPIDLPTSGRQKASNHTQSRRIQRLTRPCRLPRRRRSSKYESGEHSN